MEMADLGDIIQIAPYEVTNTGTFRKLVYPYTCKHLALLTNSESVGVDPCAVHSFQRIADDVEVLDRT